MWEGMVTKYYYPKTKKELVYMLSRYFPGSKFKTMKIEQLRAIRLNIINKFLKKS